MPVCCQAALCLIDSGRRSDHEYSYSGAYGRAKRANELPPMKVRTQKNNTKSSPECSTHCTVSARYFAFARPFSVHGFESGGSFPEGRPCDGHKASAHALPLCTSLQPVRCDMAH